jgi:hypothetical protein
MGVKLFMTNKELDAEKKRFRGFYIGAVVSEFDDDFFLFRSLKRTINSYIKVPDKSKIHSICNKIVILRRVFDEDFLYEEIFKIVSEDIYKINFMKYIMNEVFCTRYKISEFDPQWEDAILELFAENKIQKQEKIILQKESAIYLLHIKNQAFVR